MAVVWARNLPILKKLANLSSFPGAAALMVGSAEYPPMQKAIERYDVVHSELTPV